MGEANKKDEHVVEVEIIPELEALKAELVQKTEIAQELENRILRLQADMDNLRKRTMREKEETWYVAAADIMTQLLPTLDNFERAMQVLPQNDWARGIAMVSKQLQDVLARLGLETIESQGSFNPQYHEAIMQDIASTEPENMITGEFERGYKLRGKVLRPSKVKVSTGGNNNV
ncbi:MAG: molecular chaperone GrpE [Bacillota bacterium]|nr:MAG: molecular chaperone GrpE [Bacillota bacterium]